MSNLQSMRLVIATRGRRDLLQRTLSSLAEAKRPSGFRGVTVIENGGGTSAREVVLRFKELLSADYLYTPVANKSAALNLALERMRDCLVVFTDDDVRVDGQMLVAYADAAARYGAGHFFGGPVDADYEREPPGWLKPYLPFSARGWSSSPNESNGEPLVFLGANWAAYHQDLKAAGWFDAAVGPGAATGAAGQETAMQVRLRERGSRAVYVPDAKVWHYVPAKRCSPAWALKRQYRSALGYGMLHQAPRPGVSGYPFGAIRQLLLDTLALLPAECSFSPEKRFEARHRCLSTLGYLRGRRLAYLNRNGRRRSVQIGK